MSFFKEERLWLVTGAAGFIGSHLVEALLKRNQCVLGVDNFLTGSKENIDAALEDATPAQKNRFQFCEGDLRDENLCHRLMKDVNVVFHQAALASVPRSIETPLLCHAHNVNVMANLLDAAKDAKPQGFVYASSSSVYGDNPALPKKESDTGKPLSPYAGAKHMMEVYGDIFSRTYGLSILGLRYFNVFGPRQSETGPYAAVIPLWAKALMTKAPIYMNGDGSNSRDFTYIQNVIDANLLAAQKAVTGMSHDVFNVGAGKRTTLHELYAAMTQAAGLADAPPPIYRDPRAGDIPHSLACTQKAAQTLDYMPKYSLEDGLKETLLWFFKNQMCLKARA